MPSADELPLCLHLLFSPKLELPKTSCLLDLAENWLNIRRIGLQVYTDNERAIALYKNFGFEIEATHRALVFRDGEYGDAYSMARLRDGEPSI